MSFSLSGIINTVSSAVSTLAPLAMPFFPQAQIAMAGVQLLNQAVGGGVNQALDILGKEAGMPKFLQSAVRDLVKDFIGKPGNDDCCNAVRDRCGNDFRDIADGIGRSIADIVKGIKKCDDDEGSSSWLVAIAKAMGRVAGEHMKKVSQLSDKLETLSADAGNKEQNAENAKQAGITTNELQGETQMVSLLQNAFSNALKSLGESLSTMARK